MRIAISADDQAGLDGVVNPHFGRCPFFAVVDVEGTEIKSVESVQNPYYGHHQPGQVPGFIKSLDADVMLAGGMGGRAIQFFQQLGIEATTGAAGSVRNTLERFLGGELQGVEPCAQSMEHEHGDILPAGEYEKDEAGRLREEIELLQEQLAQAAERLDRL